jgi:hypothetical protein
LPIVATITRSIWSAGTPDFSIASFDASVARSMARMPAEARVRVLMPVRCWIHSSLESMGPMMSALGTTRSPRAAP